MAEKKDELIEIVGSEGVIDDPQTLEAYSKDQSFAAPRKPQSVVKPKNVDEVQRIVKWANQTATPLVPVSSGPPHFHGDTVPSLGEAVIVDLSEMKRIIKIDRRNRVTIVEPGVTFGQLQPELAKEGMRLPMPLLPRRSKSVVGSLLEREPTLTPRYHWVLTDPLRCIEVIWGSGDKLSTGQAGWYPPLEKQEKGVDSPMMAMGPGQADFYRFVQGAQGSMGIVTWASARCEVLPQVHKLLLVPSEKLDDLLDFAYRLLRLKYGDEILFLNSSNLAFILGEDVDQIRALREELPPWVLILGVAGFERLPKEWVELQVKAIMDIAQQFGLGPTSAIPGTGDGQVLEILSQPSTEPYWKLRYKGGCQDIFFLTTLDRAPEFVSTLYSVAAAQGYPTSEIGIYIQPAQQGVACHCEFSLPFNPDNPGEVKGVQELFLEGSKALIQQGAFFSRPYGIWADMAYNRDEQTTIVLKKIKGIFDPNNVMNPSKLCF